MRNGFPGWRKWGSTINLCALRSYGTIEQKWISRLARGGETKRMSTTPESSEKQQPDGIAMPQPAAAPMVLALGIVLMAAGLVLGIAMSLVGLAIFIAGLGAWIRHLLPGRGHVHEE